MELKDRVVVIDEKNMAGLSWLYGEMNIDELGRTVPYQVKQQRK